MRTDTRAKMYDYIQSKKAVQVKDIVTHFNISQVATHRQLNTLLREGKVVKTGKPPVVFYLPTTLRDTAPFGGHIESIAEARIRSNQAIKDTYLYISPEGQILPGTTGFITWATNIHEEKNLELLAQEYSQIRKNADAFYQKKPWIVATDKATQTFKKNTFLDALLYQDFYALPKFGKTKLGQLVLHAKQAQHVGLIHQIGAAVRPVLNQIITEYKIDAICFVPHSIPRKIPFLKELERYLTLTNPQVKVVKAYSGEVPVAQKSLAKLEERIANARQTLFVADKTVPYQNVLLIDDAVGSGSTCNELASKLKNDYQVAKVIGFGIVGSYKGFEVIKEV